MDPQRWLDEVRNELQTRRLPKRYVMRLMRELSDHVLDGWETTMNKDVRVFDGPHDQLGSPKQVADTAEQEFQSRRFAARFPLLTFGLAPLLAFPLVAAATFVGPGWVIVTLLELLGLDQSLTVTQEMRFGEWVPTLAKTYAAATIILAAGLIVWMMSRFAKKAGVRLRWPVTSAVLVALIAGCIWTDATPKTPEKQGTVMLGLGYPLRTWTIFQTVQLAAPLALAAWLVGKPPKATSPPVEFAQVA
ncbi:MAG TPA: hypothetical protein VM510_00145 [Caulifigura sp.]|nr:hypothetical protein [Caulifigura sp.]